MQAGDVILWENFDLQRLNGPDKNRWFIYLGDTGSFSCPQIMFLVTPTTNYKDFQKYGNRENHKIVRFSPDEDSPFPVSCVIDVEFDFYDNFTKSVLTSYEKSITHKGRISNQKIIEIWNIIKSSKKISKIICRDIKRCLETAGYKL